MIYGEHMHDDSVKNGMVKCLKCDKEFDVPRSGFPSNERVANILAKHRHLSKESKSAIQELIQKLEQLQIDVKLKQNAMEVTSFDHFTEIRRFLIRIL